MNFFSKKIIHRYSSFLFIHFLQRKYVYLFFNSFDSYQLEPKYIYIYDYIKVHMNIYSIDNIMR